MEEILFDISGQPIELASKVRVLNGFYEEQVGQVEAVAIASVLVRLSDVDVDWFSPDQLLVQE
jgi:hypothetical protein